MKNNLKNLFIFFVAFLVAGSLSACTMDVGSRAGQYAHPAPNSPVFKTTEGFDFIQMHNDIVDRLNEEGTDIFYITGNSLDIDGDNEKKEIHLTFEVFMPTSDREIELAVSWMMKLIGDEAAAQQFKYEPASTTSFGTVWNDYDLVINVRRQSGSKGDNQKGENQNVDSPSYIKTIKAGDAIPYEPRAITWGDDYIESEESEFEFERD